PLLERLKRFVPMRHGVLYVHTEFRVCLAVIAVRREAVVESERTLGTADLFGDRAVHLTEHDEFLHSIEVCDAGARKGPPVCTAPQELDGDIYTDGFLEVLEKRPRKPFPLLYIEACVVHDDGPV